MPIRLPIAVSFVLCTLAVPLLGQTDIYLGAGNDSTITVTTSHDHQLFSGPFIASGDKTVNGDGMNAKRMEASRFLAQSTLSYDHEMIDEVMEIGFEAWIDSQFTLPATLLTDSMLTIFDQSFDIWVANGNDSSSYASRPNYIHSDYAWWHVSVRAEDALRQRVAEALSQIVVVSNNSVLSSYSLGMTNYYDILIEHALGNYEELIMDITMCPAMANYLTYVNNPNSDTALMQFPDENYARELMQLMMIGLDSLNQDGTPVEVGGNRIPTYDNEDIAEFAKIFTGLSYSARWDGNDPYWGLHIYWADLTEPLMMYEEYHEQGEKRLLHNYVVPDGQTGMEDVEEAVNHLFLHPNVGPFIAKQLIQRLVKSNPTPAYVYDVASAFNDNGSGVRGDLKAVVKAILLHDEARSCSWVEHPEQGQLREPILRKTQFAGLFEPLTPMPGKYWNYSYWYRVDTDMHPMWSPSVFNFYHPAFSPNGAIADQGLVAPEFGIFNTRTSIGYANQLYRWIESERLLQTSWYEDNQQMPPDLSALLEYSKDPDALIDYLDVILTHGQLTDETRAIIKDTLAAYGLSISNLVSKVNLATYLILASPDYTILK